MSAVAATSANPPIANRATPRFVMIGGFLGVGKTTLASRLATHFTSLGKKVGYISNDECSSVVDTAIMRAAHVPAEHVAGGSFGVQFDSLSAAAARLIENVNPDIIIAEPVGSAADLANGVNTPLRRKQSFSLAPFSVVVDATRIQTLLNGSSPKIAYLCRQQLEEAEIIVINKIDRVAAADLSAIQKTLSAQFPHACTVEASARTGAGLDHLLSALSNESSERQSPSNLDAKQLAEAESFLGCLNSAVRLSAMKGFQCNPILVALAERIRSELAAVKIPVAHLKMALLPEVDVPGVATLNLVYSSRDPEVGADLDEPVERAQLAVNLRAEGKPDLLHAAVTNAFTQTWASFPTIFARLTAMEHFRPNHSRPQSASAI